MIPKLHVMHFSLLYASPFNNYGEIYLSIIKNAPWNWLASSNILFISPDKMEPATLTT